jgi:transcription antitermination protein NusB
VSSRREARRTALFLLFQWDVTGRPLGSLYEGEVDSFADDLARRVTERAEELDARIDETATD